jgi:hypothetical protein
MKKGWIIGVLAALAITACGGSTVSTADVKAFVLTNFIKSVPGVTTVPTATCVQATDNTWNCLVNYDVIATTATGIGQQAYQATLNVTCDSTGTCEYPAFTQTPVNP